MFIGDHKFLMFNRLLVADAQQQAASRHMLHSGQRQR
jgi:hypothetical protein